MRAIRFSCEDEELARNLGIGLHGVGTRYVSVVTKDHRIFARVILGVIDPTILVDHRDGDSLNCIRENLRLVTFSENAHNRKKYKLIRHDLPHGIEQTGSGKYRAKLSYQGARFYSASYKSIKDAVDWYEAQSLIWFGDKARHLHRNKDD